MRQVDNWQTRWSAFQDLKKVLFWFNCCFVCFFQTYEQTFHALLLSSLIPGEWNTTIAFKVWSALCRKQFAEIFNYTQAISNSSFSSVLVNSLYSNASWRIHICSPVLAFILPSSSPRCALYSPRCNSSGDKLCVTKGKVNADSFSHWLLLKLNVRIIELHSESVCFSTADDFVCFGMEQTGNFTIAILFRTWYQKDLTQGIRESLLSRLYLEMMYAYLNLETKKTIISV